MPDLATPLIAPPLIEWYREFARDLPWRRPDFGAWGVLVSEFMLQQTPVNRVIPHLEAWLERWPTPACAGRRAAGRGRAAVGEPRLSAAGAVAAPGGGRDQRAARRASCPRDVDDLLALSGVGDYTARAVAVFAHGERHPVVDTNTRRVLARVLAGRAQPGPPARRDLAVMESILPAGHGGRSRRQRRDHGARRDGLHGPRAPL